VGFAISCFEDEWADRLQRMLDGRTADPMRGFRTHVRNRLKGVTADDIVRDAIFAMGLSTPPSTRDSRRSAALDRCPSSRSMSRSDPSSGTR
jgi:hypothetical protein